MMGSAGITNVGPINTPTTNTGAIAGFDPIMKWSKKKTKSRKKQESAGKQWVRRRDDPNHIDGRSKAARKLLKRISKRKKKMSEAFIQESGEATKQAYKFLQQRRKVQKKQEREKRAANRKQEIQTIARAKSSDYQKKAKDRQKKIGQQMDKQKKQETFDGLIYLQSLIEQIENTENTNPVTYFYNDDTELELTQVEAAYVITKFNELSEEHKDAFVDQLAQSSEFTKGFIEI